MKTLNPNKQKLLTFDQFEEILVYFSNSIHHQTTIDDVLWDLAKNCISKLGFTDCVVYLIDHQKNELLQKAAFGPKNPKDREIYCPAVIKLGEGISGSVAVSGVAEIIPDTSKDFRYIVDDERRFSEITIPIKINDEVIGIIDCEHPRKNFFSPQHERILTAIAAMCAIKIENIRNDAKIKNEQEKLLQVREEMLQLKLKAFRSQMNPHFIFNALNAIQYFITSKEKKLALNYLSVFSKLIRFYIKHMESETVNLAEEVAMLKGYLTLQKLRYGNLIEYEIQVEEETDLDAVAIPSFVLQTLLENSIEYAIYKQFRNYKIKAHFRANTQRVFITISFTYDATTADTNYTPEYREQLVKWQDQIRMLRKLKSYVIEKKIHFTKRENSDSGYMILVLPNLI